MADASLDGIRIEVEHATPADQVVERLEAFAQDLAENRFPDWGCTIQREDDGRLHLRGGRDRTHFQAVVLTEPTRVVMDLKGQVAINRFKLALAGGAEGLRRRVADEITKVLRTHLT